MLPEVATRRLSRASSIHLPQGSQFVILCRKSSNHTQPILRYFSMPPNATKLSPCATNSPVPAATTNSSTPSRDPPLGGLRVLSSQASSRQCSARLQTATLCSQSRGRALSPNSPNLPLTNQQGPSKISDSFPRPEEFLTMF